MLLDLMEVVVNVAVVVLLLVADVVKPPVCFIFIFICSMLLSIFD